MPLLSMFQSCSCDVASALCTPSCLNAFMTFPLETLPSPGDTIVGVIYLLIILSPEESSRIYISDFGKGLFRKSDNVVVFPFSLHIAVQQPFKPLWSRLLLCEVEQSRASFALCFKALQMTLLLTSVSSAACTFTCPAREALPSVYYYILLQQ